MVPTQASSSSSQPAAKSPWSEEERVVYVAALGLASDVEEWLLHFLGDALALSPLPAPWEIHRAREQQNQVFFLNTTNGETTWAHPLEHLLQDLAATARMCLVLPLDLRKSCVASLCETWEVDATRQLSSWYPVDFEDTTYYCNSETNETMWDSPVEVFGPVHFVRIKSAQALCDEEYVVTLHTRDWTPGKRAMSRSGASTFATTAGTLMSGRSSTCFSVEAPATATVDEAEDEASWGASAEAEEHSRSNSSVAPSDLVLPIRSYSGLSTPSAHTRRSEATPAGPEHFALSPANSAQSGHSATRLTVEDVDEAIFEELVADADAALADQAWLNGGGPGGPSSADAPDARGRDSDLQFRLDALISIQPDSDVAAYERAAEALLQC